MENLTEQKPLTKQIGAAITALQKEIDRKQRQVDKVTANVAELQIQADDLVNDIADLHETIKKLRGE